MVSNKMHIIKLDTDFNDNVYQMMFNARNNLSVWSWTRQDDLINIDSHLEWCRNMHKDKSIKMYIIRTIFYSTNDNNIRMMCYSANDNNIRMMWDSTKENNVVGICGFTSIRGTARNAEFSLYIFPEHMKKGLGKKALIELINHGFDQLNLELIYGECFEKNIVARGIYKKLGFVEEGLMRNRYFRNGEYHNSIPISIKKSEWEKQRK